MQNLIRNITRFLNKASTNYYLINKCFLFQDSFSFVINFCRIFLDITVKNDSFVSTDFRCPPDILLLRRVLHEETDFIHFITAIVLLPFILSASALSDDEALVRKRAYYAGIESSLSLLSRNLGTLENVQIQKSW